MHCITTNLREMDEVAKMCVLLCHIIILLQNSTNIITEFVLILLYNSTYKMIMLGFIVTIL